MGKSFLSERIATRQQAFSLGGKIRVGTKAISKRAAENKLALELFQKAEQGLMSFHEAAKEIFRACEIANPFYPKNTQEFHVHPWDMITGGAATSRRILELYGEKRGKDTAPKLYRFPVVFPDVKDFDLDTLVGGGLAVQGGGAETIRYSSRYEPDGSRVCTHLPEIVRTPDSKRKVVQHVQRRPIVRGPCVPEECSEYAFGMCKFSGKVRFYIPEIAGAGVFELHTGSTEAASQIYLRLSQAMQVCNGRLPNFTPDGRPVFWISKAKVTRQYFDENQLPKMGEQWVPQLDMEIELPKVLWLRQQAQSLALTSSGREPAAVPLAWLNSSNQDLSADSGEHQKSSSPVMDVVPQMVDTSTTQTSVQMLKHAAYNGYGNALDQWASAQWGEAWKDMKEPAKSWERMYSRFGDKTGTWIAFSARVHALNLNSELVLKYMHIKVGPLGAGELIPLYVKALEELCIDGESVAREVMLAAVRAVKSK